MNSYVESIYNVRRLDDSTLFHSYVLFRTLRSQNSMGIAGYGSVCVQFYCVGCHCLSLHVSAYMGIFRCVGFFIYLFSYA
jgi:hypothetical protein